jgi:hypothetical protein
VREVQIGEHRCVSMQNSANRTAPFRAPSPAGSAPRAAPFDASVDRMLPPTSVLQERSSCSICVRSGRARK